MSPPLRISLTNGKHAYVKDVSDVTVVRYYGRLVMEYLPPYVNIQKVPLHNQAPNHHRYDRAPNVGQISVLTSQTKNEFNYQSAYQNGVGPTENYESS